MSFYFGNSDLDDLDLGPRIPKAISTFALIKASFTLILVTVGLSKFKLFNVNFLSIFINSDLDLDPHTHKAQTVFI